MYSASDASALNFVKLLAMFNLIESYDDQYVLDGLFEYRDTKLWGYTR